MAPVDPRAAPPEPAITGTERFNVPGVLRMLDAEAAGAFGSARTLINLVGRLIRQQQTEIERLRAALERIVRIVDDDGDPDCLEHKIARAALAVNRLEPKHADQS